MDWIDSLIDGMGKAISDSLKEVWGEAAVSIFDLLIRWMYDALYNAFSDVFTFISDMGARLFDLPWIKAFLSLFSAFAWVLFLSGLVVAVFEIAIEYQSMRTINIKRHIMPIIYGFLAVNLFTQVPIRLYVLCINLQDAFMHDLAFIAAIQNDLGSTLTEIALSALGVVAGVPNLTYLFLIIALGYSVIKIFFANIKRGGILLTQIAVGSLYMFSLPRGYTDGFTQWCKQIVALCLTAFLQTTLLFLGLITWHEDVLLGLGIILAANEVPRIAQNFGLDTSIRVNMMSAVHTTTTAINLTRALAKK